MLNVPYARKLTYMSRCVICHCYCTSAAETEPTVTPSESLNHTTSSAQELSPTIPISQSITPGNSPSAAQQSSGVLTTASSQSSYIAVSWPLSLLKTSMPSMVAIPQTSPTAGVQATPKVADDRNTTSHSLLTGQAAPTSTHTGPGTTKHDTHPPIVVIALALGIALFFALLAVLYLCVRRLRRRRAYAKRIVTQKSTIVQKADEGPGPSSEVYAQCILGDVMNRPETPGGRLPSLVGSTHEPRVDALNPDRTPSSIEGAPLLRHSTASTPSPRSTVQSISMIEGIEHESYFHLEPLDDADDTNSARFNIANGVVSRTMRDSWDSDERLKDTGEEAILETNSTITGWHPSRMVRPPSGSYDGMVSSKLVRRRDTSEPSVAASRA